jgi:hypothetical protein
VGVRQFGVVLGQLVDLLFRAVHDPHGFAAPFDRELLARRDAADVDLHWRTGRFRALPRLERADEGDGSCHAANRASTAGDGDPGASTLVDSSLSRVRHGCPQTLLKWIRVNLGF